MSAPSLSLPLFLLALALVVPGALLLVGVRWLYRTWRARKFNAVELRCAEEQARYLPRNPSRDEAKRDLRAAELKEGAAEGHHNDPALCCVIMCRKPRDEGFRLCSDHRCRGNFAGADCERVASHGDEHRAKCGEPPGRFWWSWEDERRLVGEMDADLRGDEPALKHIVKDGRVEWLTPHAHSGDPSHVDRDFRAWECEQCTQMRAARYVEGNAIWRVTDPFTEGGPIWQVTDSTAPAPLPSHISTSAGYVTTTTTDGPLSFASNASPARHSTSAWSTRSRNRIHPLGWACVYVANYSDHAGGWLCAVPPNGPAVHCFSEIREAWEPAPDWLADAARRVLGEST